MKQVFLFVKRRIECIEVFGIKVILCNSERFAETYKMKYRLMVVNFIYT